MKESLIDTHAHLSFPEYRTDIEEIIKNSQDCNVEKIINIALGSNLNEITGAAEIANFHSHIFNSIGIHPNHVESWEIKDFDSLLPLIEQTKTVAIGETGLDLYRSRSNLDKQIEFFHAHIELALKKNIPLIIHQRDAFDEVISILKTRNTFGKIPVVFHCFGGNEDQSSRIISLGGHISLTGIITFKKADALRKTVLGIPLEKIMLETDCPFLAPEPKRGKRNEPGYLIHTAKGLSEIMGKSLDVIARQTTENAKKFFKL